MPANGGLVAHPSIQHQQIPSFHNAPTVQDEEIQRRQNNGINKYRQRHEVNFKLKIFNIFLHFSNLNKSSKYLI